MNICRPSSMLTLMGISRNNLSLFRILSSKVFSCHVTSYTSYHIGSVSRCACRHVSTSSRLLTKRQVDTDDDVTDKPIQFTTSKAAEIAPWDAYSGKNVNSPPFEATIVWGSFAAMLIYFGILREENDIDQELGKSLFHRVDGLEEVQLRKYLSYARIHKLEDVEAVEKRLKEVIEEREAKEAKSG